MMNPNEILAAFKIVVMITIVSTITVLLAILCLPETNSTSSDSIIEINTLYDIYYIDVSNNQVTFESNSDTLQFSNISSISSYIRSVTGEDARRCAGIID